MIFNTIVAVNPGCVVYKSVSRSNLLIIELINGPPNEQQPATEKPNEVNACLLYPMFPIRISSVYLIIDSARVFSSTRRVQNG